MAKDKPTLEGDRVDYRGTKYTLEDAVMLGLIPPAKAPTDQGEAAEEVPGEAAEDQHGDNQPGDAVASGSRRPRRQG